MPKVLVEAGGCVPAALVVLPAPAKRLPANGVVDAWSAGLLANKPVDCDCGCEVAPPNSEEVDAVDAAAPPMPEKRLEPPEAAVVAVPAGALVEAPRPENRVDVLPVEAAGRLLNKDLGALEAGWEAAGPPKRLMVAVSCRRGVRGLRRGWVRFALHGAARKHKRRRVAHRSSGHLLA